MGIALASVVAMIVLFVAVIVVSFELLHQDEVTRDAPSPLEPVRILGAEERVFNWAQDRCEDDDVPDLPARAFRDQSGRVQLISAHFVNRRFVGRTLNSVNHQCDVLMMSGNQPDPAQFNDREWIAAPYTSVGRTVHALVHNEYQGNQHPGQCSSGEYFKCWYNALTLAVSRDGGRSFQDARPPPTHLVASIPYRYEPNSGSKGIFSPSNIVRNREDGYYYALARAARERQQQQGACLLRTNDLGDPQSWRAWDGSDFVTAFVNPYGPVPGGPSDHVCEPVGQNQIDGMHESLTYNTYLDKYLLVGLAASASKGRRGPVWGIHYSVSDDLIDWSPRKLVTEAKLPWTYDCGDSSPILYPSILDPKSTSRNFETSGQRPYLYFTRFHYRDCVQTSNRDLMRIRVEFSK
jgi:hypothetical protein